MLALILPLARDALELPLVLARLELPLVLVCWAPPTPPKPVLVRPIAVEAITDWTELTPLGLYATVGKPQLLRRRKMPKIN